MKNVNSMWLVNFIRHLTYEAYILATLIETILKIYVVIIFKIYISIYT